MKKVVCGIDIGGTKTAIAFESLEGERIAAKRLPTLADGYATIDSVIGTIEKMLAANNCKLVSIGIGCPSPLDIEKGLVLSPSNLLAWENFPIVKLFREKFGVPVALDNDANTAAFGEYASGAGRGYENILYVTVSTGIGGGIILNGEIYQGVSLGAGELGHTIVQPNGGVKCNCGSVGCLETVCAGVHIARRTREKLAGEAPSIMREMIQDLNEVSAKTLIDAVRKNDQLAVEIWEETVRYLAIGIGNAISILAPEAVVIGGGVASATGDLLFAPLRKLLPNYVSMIPAEKINVLPAALGDESGIYGALALAKKVLSKNIQTYAI